MIRANADAELSSYKRIVRNDVREKGQCSGYRISFLAKAVRLNVASMKTKDGSGPVRGARLVHG